MRHDNSSTTTKMRLQDQFVRMTQRAGEDFIRAVDALPEDKRNWSPQPGTRSAISMVVELIHSARWMALLLAENRPLTNEDHLKARETATAPPPPYAELKQDLKAAIAELCAAIGGVADAHLEREIQMPFGGGSTMNMADCISLHYWNTVYHQGQVNYIQTMLGDFGMH